MTSLLTAYSNCHFPEFEEGMYRQHDAQAFLHLGFDKMGVTSSLAITTQPTIHIAGLMKNGSKSSHSDYFVGEPQTEAGHFYQLVLPPTSNKLISLQNLLHQQDTLLSNLTEPKSFTVGQYFAHFQQKPLQAKEKICLNMLPTYKKEDNIEFALRYLEPITQIFTIRGFRTDQKQVQQWIEERTLRRNDNQDTNHIPSYEIQLPCTQNYTYHVTGPYVLFHLKLFAHNLATNTITKKDIVILPERTLVLPTSKSKTATFHFAGAVMHRGPYGSGHYVAYRPISATQWALFDDAKVTPMSLDVVLQRIQNKTGGFVPYLLLYKQDKPNTPHTNPVEPIQAPIPSLQHATVRTPGVMDVLQKSNEVLDDHMQKKGKIFSLFKASFQTTLLHKAVRTGKPLETIEFLANEMTDQINAIDENQKMALDYVEINSPIYQLLVAKRAYRTIDLQLLEIAHHGKPKDLEYALQQGANLAIKDRSGRTLSQIAKQAANFEMACIFQEKEYKQKLAAQKHHLLTESMQPVPSHKALLQRFSQQLQVSLEEIEQGTTAEQALVHLAGITRPQSGTSFRGHMQTDYTEFKLKMDAAEVLQWLAYYTQHYAGLFQKIQLSTDNWVYITLDTYILYHQVIPKLAKSA